MSDLIISVGKNNFSFPISLIANLSSGALFILMKCILYYNDNGQPPTIKQLINLSGYSRNTCYLYYKELKEKKIIGNKDYPAFLIKKDTVEYKKLNIGEGTTKFVANEKRRTLGRNVMQEIKMEVIDPFFTELEKRGIYPVVTPIKRNQMFGKIRKVLKQYSGKLGYKEILEIMLDASKNRYIQENNLYTNIDFIFFGVDRFVTKYLNLKTESGFAIPKNAFFVCDYIGNVLDPEEYGYFEFDGWSYKLVVPKNKDSIYYKINVEMLSRLNGKYDEKFNKYFDGSLVKKEYRYLTGSAGENDRFVKR